ncbi:MAG TPA: glycoside hydrolase family 2 protein, partial [Longimicrobiales bacterium]|nr:glycoside hydrolase family 2 protein [Longimicrobiales bacterium]
RVVTGRVMARVFDEWRSAESRCGGGLVWFLQDLRPGAGWGLLDSDGRPKAAYHHLRRAWAPVRLLLLDRGLDGLRIEVVNEGSRALEGELRVEVLNEASVVTARAGRAVSVPGRGSLATSLEELVGHFLDATYAYRFGPLAHAAVVATLSASDPPLELAEVRWSAPARPLPDTSLAVEVEQDEAGVVARVTSSALARDVRLDAPGWLADDDYFDLPPGATRSVRLVRLGAGERPLRGFVHASNAAHEAPLELPD